MTSKEMRALHPGDSYVAYHATRYEMLIQLLDERLVGNEKILDIGRSKLTDLIALRYSAEVDTLGFAADEKLPHGMHYQFNLNRSQNKADWRQDLPAYDLIVMAEVIEHLTTAPELVLSFVASLLKPNGVLIVQTPNAVSLHKRLLMLIGRNPYMRIRLSDDDPGHFREYTQAELTSIGKAAGLSVSEHHLARYFDYRFARAARVPSAIQLIARLAGVVLNGLYRVVPRSLRPGHTVVFTKAS